MSNSLDIVVNFIIEKFTNNDRLRLRSTFGPEGPSHTSRELPCSCCRTYVSPTWRPGPAGSGTLCNVCGLNYKKRDDRPRIIDLVLVNNTAMWMQRNKSSFQWEKMRTAIPNDPRIISWKESELDKINYSKSKKRKFLSF
jgi:hypothetical protein